MHGTFEPRRPERPHPPQRSASRLVVRILLREAVVGCPLYLLLGRNPVLDLVIYTMAFGVLLALTSRHGLLHHRTRLDVVTECFAILLGGLACRNLLALAPTLMSRH